MICPCDLKKYYTECCGRYHKGLLAENALALMRSRYSAYALHLASYIIKTTHPENPQAQSDHKQWTKDILAFSKKTLFKDLEIIDFSEKNECAYVTFSAYLEQEQAPFILQERSLFKKVDGAWLYVDAVANTNSPKKI